MKEVLTGVVVRSAAYGEAGKILTLLTAEGKKSIFLNGARGYKNRNIIMSQLFTYGEYTVSGRAGKYYVSDVALIENFFEIYQDPLRLSLASYICEIAEQVSVENEDEGELLALTLNMFYVLTVTDLPVRLIKAAFEARIMVLQGIAPEMDACRDCGRDETFLYLDVMEGNLVCPECLMKEEDDLAAHPPQDEVRTARILIPTEAPVRAHLWYLLNCLPKKLFQFESSPEVYAALGKITETYILNHLECRSTSLATYRELLAATNETKGAL